MSLLQTCGNSRMESQTRQTLLRVSYGRVSVLGGRIERGVRRDVVARSALLSDLVASCQEQTTTISTPLHTEQLDIWIAYAAASNKANSAYVSQLRDEMLVKALEARPQAVPEIPIILPFRHLFCHVLSVCALVRPGTHCPTAGDLFNLSDAIRTLSATSFCSTPPYAILRRLRAI